MELLEDICIRCNGCGKITRIHKEDIDFVTSISYDYGDNRMGEEIEYSYKCVIRCGRCHRPITFEIFGSEYPVGSFNYEHNNIAGGRFVEEPHMGVIYGQEDFDPKDAYPEYTRVQQLITEIAKNPKIIYQISSRRFEEVIEQILIDHGFETTLTQPTRDGGRDIIATKIEMGKPVVFYFECKRYGEKNSVGVSIVRSLYGVQTSDRINKAILVTTGHVTRDARVFVDKQNSMMSIIDVKEIHELICRSANKYKMRN